MGNILTHEKDFESVYAPVADFTLVLLTLRVCFSVEMEVSHVDANVAFLNEYIDRKVFVRYPRNAPGVLLAGTVKKHVPQL